MEPLTSLSWRYPSGKAKKCDTETASDMIAEHTIDVRKLMASQLSFCEEP